MNETDEIKKYGADKVALLGLLIIGLLLARFITSERYTGPRSAGRKLVAEIKRKGISSFLENRDRQSFFLIKNAADHTMGFTMDVFTGATADAELNIQSAGLVYTRGRYNRKQIMFFQSNDSFDQFSWKSKTVGPQGSSDTEITLREDGLLTVTRPNRNQVEPSYKPGTDAIPDLLLEVVFIQFLESDHGKIIIDAISADGKMVQVLIFGKTPEDIRPSETEPAHQLKIEFIDSRRRSQLVYLDDHARITLIEQDGIYFERSNRENVLGQFPEWRDYILDANEIMEPNQP